MSTIDARRARLRELHLDGTFVIPNPFDVGSAVLLARAGAVALATTSAGLAMSLGRPDMSVSRDELLTHVEAMSRATDLPLSVDAERGFGDTPADVAATIRHLAAAGAAGASIEDYDPTTDSIDPSAVAVARVAAAVQAADESGMTLTARCEHHLHGVDNLDATIARLRAFADTGAHCVYAPGLIDPGDIQRVVREVGAPVNVLLRHGGPSVPELAALGVRRVSLGSLLSNAAYAAVTDGFRAATAGM